MKILRCWANLWLLSGWWTLVHSHNKTKFHHPVSPWGQEPQFGSVCGKSACNNISLGTDRDGVEHEYIIIFFRMGNFNILTRFVVSSVSWNFLIGCLCPGAGVFFTGWLDADFIGSWLEPTAAACKCTCSSTCYQKYMMSYQPSEWHWRFVDLI